jgi:hypothetical protein
MLVPLNFLKSKTIQTGPYYPRFESSPDLLFRADSCPKILPHKPSARALFEKKLHCVWCKCRLNSLPSAYFPKKRVEKTRKNDPKSTFFSLFRSFFSPFRPLFCPQVLSCLRPSMPLLFCRSQRRFIPRYRSEAMIENRPLRASVCRVALTMGTGSFGPIFPADNCLSRGSPLNFVASPLFFSHSQRLQVCR